MDEFSAIVKRIEDRLGFILPHKVVEEYLLKENDVLLLDIKNNTIYLYVK